ncbi:unnamed protein product [Soboliphyme baturini]|uniref:Kunitz/Bovine pancreatic trypsin inhibitor domain protein n=1 Tax=Soboliphyme baturini TaxID=241478 RepID=A0A183IRT5_9BILA|nr:unnamed protein product [Soboliphyme baturini]
MDVCHHPLDKGNCGGNFTRWSYDSDTKTCQKFDYSGCNGNGNNFQTKFACEARCIPVIPADVCSHPLDRGECSEHFPRWRFNHSVSACEPFVYSGCGGNGNNFENRLQCELRCIVDLLVVALAAGNSLMRVTMPLAEAALPYNVCLHPRDSGHCQQQFLRWWYNQNADACEQFMYTGCGGNGNNFDSRLSCEARCSVAASSHLPAVMLSQEICSFSMEYGTCRGSFSRWAYNRVMQLCVQFVYSGCGGNENNFDSKHNCELRSSNPNKCGNPNDCRHYPCIFRCCSKNNPHYDSRKMNQEPGTHFASPIAHTFPFTSAKFSFQAETTRSQVARDICDIPNDYGNCDRHFIRWAFDGETKSCIQFEYSGCGGNGNNFETALSCERLCLVRPTILPLNVCHHVLDPGPCNGNYPRWYYDDDERTCKEFNYSGCDGNGNNFASKDDCSNKCLTGGKNNAKPVEITSKKESENFYAFITFIPKMDLIL